MLQFVMRDLLEREDIERIREVVKHSTNETGGSRTIITVRKQLDALAKEEKKRTEKKNAQAQRDTSIEDEAADDEQDDEELELEDDSRLPTRVSSGRSFGKEFDFKPYVDSLTTGESWEKAKKKARCCYCNKRPTDPWLTGCNHLYCDGCYEEAQGEAAENNRDHVTCMECGQKFRHAQRCNANGELEDSQEYEAPETRSKKRQKQRVRPGREDIKEDWLSLGGPTVLPSAKTIAIKAQILNWIREIPGVKIIVYTQFIAM